MKFIVAIPDNKYYLWQVLVQIANFNKFGYDKDLIYVVGKSANSMSDELRKIKNSKDHNATFHLYKDTRDKPKYASSLRPHILSKFFKSNEEELKNEVIFYLDPDVIFIKELDFTKYINGSTWYVSDTKSYIGSKYIISKSRELFVEMCKIAKVNPNTIVNNDENAGGAQYIMKNISYRFWDYVYDTSEKLYDHMVKTSNKYSPKHPIQAWTADMWAVLWGGLLMNRKIRIDKDLDFCWASDHISKWESRYIFHNAGVVANDGKNFSKIAYQKSPFNKDIVVSNTSASYKYVEEIKYTENKFKDLIF